MIGRVVFFAVLLIGGFLSGLFVAGRMHLVDETFALSMSESSAGTSAPEPIGSDPSSAESTQGVQTARLAAMPDFSDVASRTIGGVTNISSLQVQARPRSPFFDDPFFRRFFGDDESFGYSERRGVSAGSGVVVSADGLVLTNNHVVGANMRQVTVVLADKRERDATLVGNDPWTDLALLRINERGLPTIPWGDSSQLKVAEWVLAIGNPYQLSHTVTLGIVSALGRTNVNISPYEDFIQTDAAINPGNSGGALINRNGQLIGINTAIYSESGGYQGIGFAVPSNLARRVVQELVDHGEVRRGSIGSLRTVPITDELARDLQLSNTQGALVWEIYRTSAAYQAGIRPGDVIVSVDGQPVADAARFLRVLSDAKIGSIVSISLRRQGKIVEVKVPVEQARMPRER